MFYAYAYPSPTDYERQNTLPKEDFWSDDMGEFFFKYDDVRTSENPEKYLMSFLKSTYDAAANLGNWNRDNLERKRLN